MNTITEVCLCDEGFNCGQHEPEDARHWARVLGLSPLPYDASGAYDEDEFKGRFTYGWDAA